MANFKRRRPRTYSTRHGNVIERSRRYKGWSHWGWLRTSPRSWDVVMHRRPMRRRSRVKQILVMKGYDPDGIAWPVSKKPHIYYW